LLGQAADADKAALKEEVLVLLGAAELEKIELRLAATEKELAALPAGRERYDAEQVHLLF
jgi:hypothetical protein